jgi:hypothetical protein
MSFSLELTEDVRDAQAWCHEFARDVLRPDRAALLTVGSLTAAERRAIAKAAAALA